MYSPESRYEESHSKDPTLEVIEGLDVTAEEAARLFARYCTGERVARQGKGHSGPGGQPVASDTAPRFATAVRVLERVSFEEVVAGVFTN